MKRIFLAVALIFSLSLTPVWASAVQVDFLLGSFLDNNSAQLAGGYVYTYAAGTTTPKATYTDAAKTTTAANPVVLDTYGRARVYADGLYKFVIKDAVGVTIATYDNLEFVSAVNPTTIVTTSLTVSSMTAALVNIKAGTIATSTLDSSLITNSRLSNVYILSAPTLASHPVNLGYHSSTLAALESASNASLTAHTGDTTDPHGTTLTQTTMKANDVQTLFLTAVASEPTGGTLLHIASGGVVIGYEFGGTGILGFARADLLQPTRHGYPLFQFRLDTATELMHFDYLGADGAIASTITFNPNSGGSVDFGGMTLTNYVLGESSTGAGGSEVTAAYASGATVVGMAPSGDAILGTLVVPASFTAGWYDVNWEGHFSNASDTVSNYGNFSGKLFVGASQKDSKPGFIGTNGGSVTEFQSVGGKHILYLSPADALYVKGAQGTMVSNGVQGIGYYLGIRYLGSTVKAGGGY